MKKLLLLAGLMLASCSALNKDQSKDVAEDMNSFIGEGHCYLTSHFGTDVKHSIYLMYASEDRSVVVFKIKFSNSNGHFLDMYTIFSCSETACVLKEAIPDFDKDSDAKQIPTPPPEDCKGF